MANARRDTTSYAVEIEATEGTHVLPQSGQSFIQVVKDGAEFTKSQETLTRNIFTGSIGQVQSRVGIKSVTGSMPVEFRAGSSEGAAPEASPLYASAMGGQKQRTAITTKTGNSATRLEIEDLDISEFSQYDVVLVKEAGQFEMSWVFSVDTTPGAAGITLGQGLSFTPSDNVEIAAVTQYTTAESGHPSLSITKYIETTKDEQATGAKVTSMSLEGWETGSIGTMNFGFEGLTWDSNLTARPFDPEYDVTKPPIILNACFYQDGVRVPVNSLSLSLENTLGFVTSTCSPNGRISSRPTARVITGSFTPYKQDDDLTQFNNFKCNIPYTLFAYAYNPILDANCNPTGEFENATAILLTNVVTTELGESDSDGLLVEEVTFSANRGDAGTEEELKIAFV